jgi:F-type H+-transporting ATPase subunit a
MPGHHTWFDVLLGTFYKNVETASSVALGGRMIGQDHDGTWIGHGHVSLQHVFGSLLVLVLLTVMAFIARGKLADTRAALVPEDRLTVRTFVELIVEMTYGQMVGMMGPKAAKFFLPLIGTCAFMILFSNAMGLVPGFLPPTDVLNTTVPYALVIFFTTHVFGFKEHGFSYLKHFMGPVIWLAPLMFVIEIISHLARPLSLSIRLAANMIGDHRVITTFLALTPIPFIWPIPVYVMGVLVTVVQTLVFCLLSTVYISLSISHEEH